MSRHRNVRGMREDDDFVHYDDIYGTSTEDDGCISPSDAAFMYNRDGPHHQHRIGSYLEPKNDIPEEDEFNLDHLSLSLFDSVRMRGCIDQVTKLLPDFSKRDVVNAILAQNYNVQRAVSYLLGETLEEPERVSPQGVGFFSGNSSPTAVISTTTSTTTTRKTAADGDDDDVNIVHGNRGEERGGTTVIKQNPINITKGFNVSSSAAAVMKSGGNDKEELAVALDRGGNGDNGGGKNVKSFSPLNRSPNSSGRNTPENFNVNATSAKKDKRDVEQQYQKERGDSKENIHMIVIGHVDAGKSTLMGRLLCELGQVNQRTLHKYEQESRKLGKQSFMYAWVLDETGEERSRGITMDVGRSHFETQSKIVTLLDAPGHRDFIPNMISGAGQADVAVLVVDSTRGEFESGFDLGGQTREHAVLVKSLGVNQLAVAINKLDNVNWSKQRFDEITIKLKVFLKQVGFKEKDVSFVPCSGLTGQNLVKEASENELTSWYDGPTLIQVIDAFKMPERPVSKPLRFSISDVYKGTGSAFCVSGRVETGSLNAGDKLLLCPNKELVTVKSVAIEEMPKQVCFAGDQASITLTGIDMQQVTVGCILCEPHSPVKIASRFQARIIVFNTNVPITKGFPVVLHHLSLVEPALISKLVSSLNKSTGEVTKKNPRFLMKNSSAMVEIQLNRPIAVETYSDFKELGRVMLRVGGVTIAAGLITAVYS